MKFPYERIEEPHILSQFGEWDEMVYRDLLMCQVGRMNETTFREKYAVQLAILVLNMTGFTRTTLRHGSLHGFLRIFDIHKVCAPILLSADARSIRAFADNFTALFDDPDSALEAAFEIHQRVQAFHECEDASEGSLRCSIGLGYGEVFQIGPDQAMGNEMNLTSKLGEDVARGGETLITEGFHSAIKTRPDVCFTSCGREDLSFRFYRADPINNIMTQKAGDFLVTTLVAMDTRCQIDPQVS